MPWLVGRAWTELLFADCIALLGFKVLRKFIQNTPVRRRAANPVSHEAVVNAMETACAFYLKGPLCLQRSAVVTRLLRRHGVPAELVIGCCAAPLSAHAWVEVAGTVVSDDQQSRPFMAVLDRW